MPWIPGYIPKRNYQRAIFGAIDRYLSSHQEALSPVVPHPREVHRVGAVFTPPPERTEGKSLPEPLIRLVRKFDPVARDHRNRALGRAGEELVLNVERKRLEFSGRENLAKKVRWVSDRDGDGAGYDVLSFDHDGAERPIEVKTTNGSARTPFFLSKGEMNASCERADCWRLYRVYSFITDPRIFVLAPPLHSALNLTTETWRAGF